MAKRISLLCEADAASLRTAAQNTRPSRSETPCKHAATTFLFCLNCTELSGCQNSLRPHLLAQPCNRPMVHSIEWKQVKRNVNRTVKWSQKKQNSFVVRFWNFPSQGGWNIYSQWHFILATNNKGNSLRLYHWRWHHIEQQFSNFSLLRAPFTAPKTVLTPSFCQHFFDYWWIRFGHFLAWAPQVPKQEANFRLWPATNWRHQYQVKKDQLIYKLQHEHVRLQLWCD